MVSLRKLVKNYLNSNDKNAITYLLWLVCGMEKNRTNVLMIIQNRD